MDVFRRILQAAFIGGFVLTVSGCGFLGWIPLAAIAGVGVAATTVIEENEPEPTSPDLSSLHPRSGPTAGGTVLKVFGYRFRDGATVTIGGNEAANVVFESPTCLSCETPAGSAGVADVVVVNPDGQADMLSGAYIYVSPPALTSISPANGPTIGGTLITLSGSGISPGATVTVDDLGFLWIDLHGEGGHV